ncbi:MAG TPA: RNA methyltransferase [Candidatus Limnocylindrales bacterium]|nr:RNA methyltransferase [Candidatus Limnocylindrales bacterium]
MVAIESPHNPRIRAAAALRDRRDRMATGLALVDGARESLRAIEAGAPVEAAFVCPPLLRSGDALAAEAALRARGIDALEVSERAFEAVAYGDRTDGIVLVVRAPSVQLEDLDPRDSPLFLVTEDVEKPGNLGAILRTADAAGCDGVIAIGGADPFNPNVIRASAGTVFTVPLAVASGDEALAWLRGRGIRILATRVDAEGLYTDADLRGPLAIVLGSEATGLSDTWHAPDVAAVRLPMLGVADSLNVSATAAILAYEARRQRGASGRSAAPHGGPA